MRSRCCRWACPGRSDRDGVRHRASYADEPQVRASRGDADPHTAIHSSNLYPVSYSDTRADGHTAATHTDRDALAAHANRDAHRTATD